MLCPLWAIRVIFSDYLGIGLEISNVEQTPCVKTKDTLKRYIKGFIGASVFRALLTKSQDILACGALILAERD